MARQHHDGRTPNALRPRAARPGRRGRRLRGVLPRLAVLLLVAVVVATAVPGSAPVTRPGFDLVSLQDPAAPSSASITVVAGDTRLDFSWSAPNESFITGYDVELRLGTTVVDATTVTTTSYSRTGLVNGSQYTISVRTRTYNPGVVGVGAAGPYVGTSAGTKNGTPVPEPGHPRRSRHHHR